MMTSRAERIESLNTAVQRAGGLIKFCAELGVTHQAVGKWRKRGQVPPLRALAIEQKYGVSRRSIVHPDIDALLSTPPAEVLDVL